MARSKPLTGKVSVMVGDKKVTYLEVDENGKCHYLVSKEEMEKLSKRLMEKIQKGVNQYNFESIWRGYTLLIAGQAKEWINLIRKIFDRTTIALTFALTLSALGVVGSFELGNIDFAGFIIGQAVCIAGIALLAVVHYFLSKKRKSPRGAATPTKGNRKINHVYYSKER